MSYSSSSYSGGQSEAITRALVRDSEESTGSEKALLQVPASFLNKFAFCHTQPPSQGPNEPRLIHLAPAGRD